MSTSSSQSSSCFLKELTEETSTTCSGSLFYELITLWQKKNSSGDEIANVNFLYDKIVHVLQNAIDSCINSATDRRGGHALERMFTQFSETIRPTQCNGHYAVQGHSIKVTDFGTIESSYDFLLVINSNLPPILHRFQVMIQFSLARGECLTLTLSLGVIPCQYRHKWCITKNLIFWSTFLPQKV